jgi:hypothetical protein
LNDVVTASESRKMAAPLIRSESPHVLVCGLSRYIWSVNASAERVVISSEGVNDDGTEPEVLLSAVLVLGIFERIYRIWVAVIPGARSAVNNGLEDLDFCFVREKQNIES